MNPKEAAQAKQADQDAKNRRELADLEAMLKHPSWKFFEGKLVDRSSVLLEEATKESGAGATDEERKVALCRYWEVQASLKMFLGRKQELEGYFDRKTVPPK